MMRSSSSIVPVVLRSPPLQPRRRASRFVGLLSCALVGSSLISLGPTPPAQGQAIASATVTEILDGDQVFIQNQRAAVNAVAQRQQRVRTQAARASLRFNNGAVVRLDRNTSLVVGQCAQVNQGTLLVNGTLNGCSVNTVAGVRGTIYTFGVTDDGKTVIQVFEGEVVVQRPTEPLEPAIDDLEEEGTPTDPGDTANPEAIDEQAPPAKHNFDGSTHPKGNPLHSYALGDSTSAGNLLGDRLNPKDSLDSGRVLSPLAEDRLKQTVGQPTEPNRGEPDDRDGPSIILTPRVEGEPEPPPPETVDFTEDSAIPVVEGQQIVINADNNEAVISSLTAQDFIDLLEGPFVRGFVNELPGISNLRNVFQRLYPRVPLPFGISVPIPLPRIRFPF